MRPIHAGFGREKLCFLISSAAAACAVYLALVSAPLPLLPGAPVSVSTAVPTPPEHVPLSARHDEEQYVFSVVDPQSGERINRDRRNPFAPWTVIDPVISKDERHAAVKPPVNSARNETEPRVDKREFPPVALSAAVEYTGVLSAHGDTIGLLNRKDGSGYLRVREGSEFAIGGATYRVERLEKQAICVLQGGVSIRLKCE